MTREDKVPGLIDKNKIGPWAGAGFSPFAPQKKRLQGSYY